MFDGYKKLCVVLNAGLQLAACVGRAKRDFGELNLCEGLSVPQCPMLSLRPMGSLVNSNLWSLVRGLLLHTLAPVFGTLVVGGP